MSETYQRKIGVLLQLLALYGVCAAAGSGIIGHPTSGGAAHSSVPDRTARPAESARAEPAGAGGIRFINRHPVAGMPAGGQRPSSGCPGGVGSCVSSRSAPRSAAESFHAQRCALPAAVARVGVRQRGSLCPARQMTPKGNGR